MILVFEANAEPFNFVWNLANGAKPVLNDDGKRGIFLFMIMWLFPPFVRHISITFYFPLKTYVSLHDIHLFFVRRESGISQQERA